MKAQKVAAVDQSLSSLSALQEEIIHHILSFLPTTREAARTCLLSKFWLRAWHSYPFVFRERVTSNEKLKQFYKFTNDTMSRLDIQRSGGTQMFVFDSILLKAEEVDYCPLDKWINIAIDNHVKEIDLSIHHPNCTCRFSSSILITLNKVGCYQVPKTILENGSMKSLSFIGCKRSDLGEIRLIPPNDATINLTRLRSLAICGFDIDSRVLERFLKGCPLLETLRIDSWGQLLDRVKIPRSDHLKTVDLAVSVPELVHIDAANLESFRYRIGLGVTRVKSVFAMDNCLKLKHLDLEFLTTDEEWFQKFLPNLGFLETLKLRLSESPRARFLILNPSIKNIELHLDCDCLFKGIEIDAPRLSYFRYLGFTFDDLFQKFLPNLGFLETLKLRLSESPRARFLILNPSIKNIELHLDCDCLFKGIEIDAPRLSYFRYLGFTFDDLLGGAAVLVKNPPHNCRARFTLYLNLWNDRFNWLRKLREIISPFSNLKSLSLLHHSDQLVRGG